MVTCDLGFSVIGSCSIIMMRDAPRTLGLSIAPQYTEDLWNSSLLEHGQVKGGHQWILQRHWSQPMGFPNWKKKVRLDLTWMKSQNQKMEKLS